VYRVVDPYFLQRWNRLDFLCLLSSLKSLFELLLLRDVISPSIMQVRIDLSQ